MAVLRYILYSLRIRRVEYRVAELPIFLVPMLLTVRDLSAFRSAAFGEGLLIFLFLFAFGDLLNCLADRDLDALYKPHLTEAVYGIGTRGVVLQAGVSAAAATALAAHLAWLLGRWLLLPAVLVGLFLAAAYSLEPIRLKSRGLWQLPFYWLGLFTGPMLFSALLFSDRLVKQGSPAGAVFAPRRVFDPPWGVVAVAVAYGVLQTGVILVNTAEDYPEDRQMGVQTAIVRLGLPRGIATAVVLTLAGSALLHSFTTLLAARTGTVGAGAALLPLLGACAAVSIGIWRLQQRLRGRTEAEAVEEVKRSAHWVPVWITSTAVASLLAAIAVCLSTCGRVGVGVRSRPPTPTPTPTRDPSDLNAGYCAVSGPAAGGGKDRLSSEETPGGQVTEHLQPPRPYWLGLPR
jgi:4-hydroxybenzoate polyprenyltransferase